MSGTLGSSLIATREFLYPVAVAVSAVTTLTTPWLIRSAGAVATWIDRKLPRPLQTFAALYGSWLEQLRATPREKTAASKARRLAKLLVLDVAALGAVIIGAALSAQNIAELAALKLGLSSEVAHALVIAAAVARSEEHTSELQSHLNLVCRLLLEKKKR